MQYGIGVGSARGCHAAGGRPRRAVLRPRHSPPPRYNILNSGPARLPRSPLLDRQVCTLPADSSG